MELSMFTNAPVMLMIKSGNLVARIDTTIQNLSIDQDTVVIAHDHGEITMFNAIIQENPNFVMIMEADLWSLSIFLRNQSELA